MTSRIELEARYCAQNYKPLPVVLTRGEGVHVWDETGKKYLDMMSAYSAVSHGHAHPRLVRLVQEQVAQLSVVSRAFYSDKLAPFLERLCTLTGQDMALPMNTGAEAVETAIKAARKWAYNVKGVAANQAEIIACSGNFHGRTIAIVTMSDEPQYQDGFGPFPGGFRIVEYGDIDALEAAINENTAAFLVEPIQGEGASRCSRPAAWSSSVAARAPRTSTTTSTATTARSAPRSTSPRPSRSPTIAPRRCAGSPCAGTSPSTSRCS
jgi:ornithine--oxo-acid transaminase